MKYIASLLYVLCSLAQAETLSILNWEDYLSPATIAAWEKESGHTLKQIYIDNDEIRDSILSAHNSHDIDVVVLDKNAADTFGTRGVLVAPPGGKVQPNLVNVSPFWQDKCGSYSVPYLWGTVGLAYRADKLKEPPTSWKHLLQPSPALAGHVGMMDDYTDTFVPSLIMRGVSVSTDDRAVLKEVFEELKQQIPAVLTYQYAISYVGHSARADDLHLALVYSGDQYSLNEFSETENWEYVVPDEGTVLWVDCMAVISSSSKQAIAHHFIDFINQPAIAAENSETTYVATPNQAAMELLSDEFKEDDNVFPPASVLKKSQFYEPISAENLQLRDRISSTIMNIHEAQ